MTTPTPAAHYTGMTIDLLQERMAQAEREKAQLVEALSGLSKMYASAWDLVDGGLVMLPDSIPKFEKAHSIAYATLAAVQSEAA